MFTRQKILLSFLNLSGKPTSLLKLVKCSFLLTKESKIATLDTFYKFLPYKFGPFSFTLYHELVHLIDSGLVSPPAEQKIELTSTLSKEHMLDRGLKQEIEEIWKKYGCVPAKEYTGLLNGRKFHDHSKMSSEMLSYLNRCKADNFWNEDVIIANIKSIMNFY